MDIEEAKKLVLYHANTGTGAEVTKQMPPARMVVNALNDAEAENKRLRDELQTREAEHSELKKEYDSTFADLLDFSNAWLEKTDALKACEAELSACKAELARYQWQPIETAPDDEVVMLCDMHGNRWTDVGRDCNWECGFAPAYWMPLPPPPGDKPQDLSAPIAEQEGKR